MNCPCSGVYVCAYIVIFLLWPAGKISGLVYGSFSLCPLCWDSHLSSKAQQAQRTSAPHNNTTNHRQAHKCAPTCLIFISSPSVFFEISMNNLTAKRKIGETKKKPVTAQSFMWQAFEYSKVIITISVGKEELKLIWSPWLPFARLWLSCVWAAVAWHGMVIGLASTRLFSLASQHKHLLCLPHQPFHLISNNKARLLCCPRGHRKN